MKSLPTRITNCAIVALAFAVIAIISDQTGQHFIAHIFGFLALGFFSRIALHLDVIWRRKYGEKRWA